MWDECCQGRRGIGVMALREPVHGTALQREMRPAVPDILRDGLTTWCGMKRMTALPAWWCREAARRPWVGFKAPQGRHGGCPRGAATRQGAWEPGPSGPATLATPIVRLHLRALESGLNGAMRALARAGVLEAQVTGLVAGPELETTEHATGCGQATRQRRIEATRGQAQELAVTVDGGHVVRLIEAVTKMPRAGQGGKRPAHETPGTRAVVMPGPGHSGRPSPAAPGRLGSGLLGGPRAVVAGPARAPLCGAGEHAHDRDRGRPGPGHRRRG